jgi:hypothetical protein
MDEDGDFDAFPPGAVLVSRRSSPRFIALTRRAVAIATDEESTAGHMASLSRELRVPSADCWHEGRRSSPCSPGVLVDPPYPDRTFRPPAPRVLGRTLPVHEVDARGPPDLDVIAEHDLRRLAGHKKLELSP